MGPPIEVSPATYRSKSVSTGEGTSAGEGTQSSTKQRSICRSPHSQRNRSSRVSPSWPAPVTAAPRVLPGKHHCERAVPGSVSQVLSVGGSEPSAADPGGQVVWNEGSPASGGGPSARCPEPYVRVTANPSATRLLPDCSLGADPRSWPSFAVCSPTNTCASGQAGGTSRLAQLAAAALVLVDQGPLLALMRPTATAR